MANPDMIELIADAVAERVAARLKLQPANSNGSFKLLDSKAASELLSCSPEYFRQHIEPHMKAVLLPSSGEKRAFRRWRLTDLQRFIDSCPTGE